MNPTNKLLELWNEKANPSNPDLIHDNVSGDAMMKAIANDVLLSVLPVESSPVPKFEKPVLKVYTSVEDGTENIEPVVSVDPVFIANSATFKKLETLTSASNEIIQDSRIDVISNIQTQIGMQQAVKLQNNALNDLDFGILNGLIDRFNNFTMAELPDNTRQDNIYRVSYTGIDGAIGADGKSVSTFIMSLVRDVPSRYQNDVVIYMSREMWFDLVVGVFDSSAATDVLTQDTAALTFKGYPVVIIDNAPQDAFFVGSLANAYMFVPLEGSDDVVVEPFTQKGLQTMYHATRYSFVTLDNTAIRVGVLAVDPTP
ncbi:phage major capsid protein [Photobacterium swingsii]|uniref:phage major capsid protein n=1 Tax=Photobacterium swingsii TaxID=680026 RepID=UPI00352D5277